MRCSIGSSWSSCGTNRRRTCAGAACPRHGACYGRVGVLVDYHRPDWWHPLRYLFGPVMRALEPLARDLWHSDIAAWLPEDAASATQVRYYFFGRLDQMLTLTRPAASITSTGLTRSRANLHEPLLHRRNDVAASVTRRSPAAARQKRLGSDGCLILYSLGVEHASSPRSRLNRWLGRSAGRTSRRRPSRPVRGS
jgi:hypothetical protein